MLIPPAGAAELKDSVQVVLAGVSNVPARQLSPVITGNGTTVTVPGVPVAGIAFVFASTATTPISCIGIFEVDGWAATWNVAVATVPEAMAV
jgi:hypothetical protein